MAIILTAAWLLPSVQSRPAQAATVSFSGRGSTATGLFMLEAGLMTARFTHANGQRNFIVWLYDASGQRIALIANEIGATSGQMADEVKTTGGHLLDIQADGDWTITIEQPRPTGAPLAPQTYTGHGRSISPFIQLYSGIVTVRSSHTGMSNFIVWVLDRDGGSVGLAANEIGNVSGLSRAVTIREAGIHLLDIDADGDWTISVEQTTGAPTPTFTPTPTPTPSIPICTPRPPVHLNTTRSGAGRLTAAIAVTSNPGAAPNSLRILTFGAIRNAAIQVVGVGPAQAGQRLTLTGSPQSVTLAITRMTADSDMLIPFTVTDACGDWSTFVGLGPHG